jgi:hypothetical protein
MAEGKTVRSCRTHIGRRRVQVLDLYEHFRSLPGPWRCEDCEPATEHKDFDAITEHAVLEHQGLLNSSEKFNWSYVGS